MKSYLPCLLMSALVLVIAGCPGLSNTVLGVVVDAAGAPICGALVVLEGEGETLRTYTGENGEFRFDFVDPGNYTVQVTGAVGYAPSEAEPVTVEDPNSETAQRQDPVFTLVPGESTGGEICEPVNRGCAGSKGSFGGELSRQLGDLLSLGMIVVSLAGL